MARWLDRARATGEHGRAQRQRFVVDGALRQRADVLAGQHLRGTRRLVDAAAAGGPDAGHADARRVPGPHARRGGRPFLPSVSRSGLSGAPRHRTANTSSQCAFDGADLLAGAPVGMLLVGVDQDLQRRLGLFLNLLLSFRLLCWVLVLGLTNRWVRGDLPVFGAGWASWAWPGGFRRTGRQGHLRAEVAKPAPDPQPYRLGVAVPGQPVDDQPDQGAFHDGQFAVVGGPAGAALQLLMCPIPGVGERLTVAGGVGHGGHRAGRVGGRLVEIHYRPMPP